MASPAYCKIEIKWPDGTWHTCTGLEGVTREFCRGYASAMNSIYGCAKHDFRALVRTETGWNVLYGFGTNGPATTA